MFDKVLFSVDYFRLAQPLCLRLFNLLDNWRGFHYFCDKGTLVVRGLLLRNLSLFVAVARLLVLLLVVWICILVLVVVLLVGSVLLLLLVVVLLLLLLIILFVVVVVH